MSDGGVARLELAVGERRRVPLRALATAGYAWSASVAGPDPDAIAIELHRGEPPPGAPPGQSAPEEAVVEALRAGSAIVRLEQRRPWESAATPAETLELDVEVS